MSPDLCGLTQYSISCLSMSVSPNLCLYAYFKSKSNVRITNLICYVHIFEFNTEMSFSVLSQESLSLTVTL